MAKTKKVAKKAIKKGKKGKEGMMMSKEDMKSMRKTMK